VRPDTSFLDFDGKWVLVTGASSGIGRAIAIELSRHRARVILSGRDEGRLAETSRQLSADGHRVLLLDLVDHSRIVPAILKLRERIGRIYGLCHSAGVVETRPLSSNSVEVVQSMLAIHVLAGLELARAICRRDVIEEEGGSVLFISSVYGRVGMPGQTGYCASKGAISAAVRALAVELARRKIRVNSISPGLIKTDMTQKALGLLSKEQVENLEQNHPLGVGAPEDVAKAAVFLLAPDNPWITGADLTVDGGFSAH